jgi:hypothetical protein
MVLNCQVLVDAGEFEKLGSPVALDENPGPVANPAVQQPATSTYAQGQQQQQPQQQQQQRARPSQYVLYSSLLMSVVTSLYIRSKASLPTRTSWTKSIHYR